MVTLPTCLVVLLFIMLQLYRRLQLGQLPKLDDSLALILEQGIVEQAL